MENAPDNLKISLVYDQAINYAFQQNAIPVVKELRFCNDATPRKNLIINITTEPAFVAKFEPVTTPSPRANYFVSISQSEFSQPDLLRQDGKSSDKFQ